MLIQQIDLEDNVIINLLREDEFHNVPVDGTLFCVHKRYQNLQFVGSGSQGIVCSAYDTILMQMVAIKKIANPFTNLDDAKRAYRELKVLKFVDYKYIIKLWDAFITSTNHQSAMCLPESSELTPCKLVSCEPMCRDRNQIEPNKMPNSSTDDCANESQEDVLFTNSTESNQNDLYLVMDFIEMNLSQIRLRHPVDHKQVSHLIYQMFCALKYLHDAKIIHRVGLTIDTSIV